MHNIGIIGYGAFGRFLKRSWDELDDAQTLFITKTKVETVRQMASEDGIARYSADYRDLIADPDVDIVVIATPPYLHEPVAVEALRAGKSVLIEKPLAVNPAQADNIIRAAKESGRIALVDFMMRYSGIVEKLLTVCRDGLLGSLRRVVVENYAGDEGLGREHWFWDRSKSGGILIEHGGHFFDMIGWLADSVPSRTVGFASEREPGMQDKVLASVQYENGVMATFYHSFSRPSALEETTIRYVFDRGQVEALGWIPLELRLRGIVSESEAQRLGELFRGASVSLDRLDQTEAVSSGVAYPVSRSVDLTFVQSADKQAEYANCVRALMADLIAAADNPEHRTRVELADGLRSLQVAFDASRSADVYPLDIPG